MAQQKILLSWHDVSYGLGFLKNILTAFYSGQVSTRKSRKINKTGLSQEMLETSFETIRDDFPFDHIYIFHVSDEVYDKVSSRKKNRHTDNWGKDISLGYLSEQQHLQWNIVYEQQLSLKDEVAYIQEYFPKDTDQMLAQFWRRINRYSFQDQLYWFREISNFQPWKDRCTTVDLSFANQIKDLRHLEEIVQAQLGWLKKEREILAQSRCFMNLSMGNKETQVAWYLLNERGFLPRDTTFFRAFVSKNKPSAEERYKDLNLEHANKDLFQTFQTPKTYEGTLADKRKPIPILLTEYLNLGFSILLTGPRGVGKTHLLNSYKPEGKIVETISCERLNHSNYFEDEFLGTTKKEGILSQADKGILFLDDIHQLETNTQLRLLPYLSTDSKNRLHNYSKGEVEISLVCATNLELKRLTQKLHPDFFDRIVQLVLEIPALKEVPEDRKQDWQKIWEQMKFQAFCPNEPELMRWLRRLDLPGNFRDLQRIAIAYQAWDKFPIELKKMFPAGTTSLKYAKDAYGKFSVHSPSQPHSTFQTHLPLKTMLSEHKKALAEWAHQQFGSDQKAADHFQQLDEKEKISRVTLNKWRKKDFKPKENPF